MRTMAIHIPITVRYNFSFSFEQFTIFTVKSLFSSYGFFLKWRNKERKGINLLDTIFAKMVFEFSVDILLKIPERGKFEIMQRIQFF